MVKFNYDKLMRSLDFSNFVMLKHQIKSINFANKDFSEDLIELTIPN